MKLFTHNLNVAWFFKQKQLHQTIVSGGWRQKLNMEAARNPKDNWHMYVLCALPSGCPSSCPLPGHFRGHGESATQPHLHRSQLLHLWGQHHQWEGCASELLLISGVWTFCMLCWFISYFPHLWIIWPWCWSNFNTMLFSHGLCTLMCTRPQNMGTLFSLSRVKNYYTESTPWNKVVCVGVGGGGGGGGRGGSSCANWAEKQRRVK